MRLIKGNIVYRTVIAVMDKTEDIVLWEAGVGCPEVEFLRNDLYGIMRE